MAGRCAAGGETTEGSEESAPCNGVSVSLVRTEVFVGSNSLSGRRPSVCSRPDPAATCSRFFASGAAGAAVESETWWRSWLLGSGYLPSGSLGPRELLCSLLLTTGSAHSAPGSDRTSLSSLPGSPEGSGGSAPGLSNARQWRASDGRQVSTATGCREPPRSSALTLAAADSCPGTPPSPG